MGMEKQHKIWPIVLGVLALFLLGGAVYWYAVSLPQPRPAKFSVVNAAEVGEVTNPAASYILRDGGSSVKLGDKLIWAFGDSLFPKKSVDDGTSGRSNTAALADPTNPTVLTEPLDKNGAPSLFIPFTDEELAYNKASGKPDERIAIWPSAMIAESNDSALVFYSKLYVHPGFLNYEGIGIGVARVKAGQTTATRVVDNLFSGKGTSFNSPMIGRDGMVYVYSCEIIQGSFDSNCKVAKVDKGHVVDRSYYTFWDGKGWTKDIDKAKASTPGSTSGFSVMYNPYLGNYISATSSAFSKNIILRSAPSPEGPWSAPELAFTAPSTIYAVYLHPELSEQKGKTISVSYYRGEENWRGHVHLLKVELGQ